MTTEIQVFIREFFKSKPLRGSLILAGSFSRNEVSIVNNKLISDMETLFIYEYPNEKKKIKFLINELSLKLVNQFSVFPKDFEIEIECVYVKTIIENRLNLPVHQLEAIRTKNYVFDNLSFNLSDYTYQASKESIYDIFIHRILNQISLAFNFNNNELNSIYLNRARKNTSDFLTYFFLINLSEKNEWITKKEDRLELLINNSKLNYKTCQYINFKNQNINISSYEQFQHWKLIMSEWHESYKKLNPEFISCSNNKSSISKIYNYILYLLKKILLKEPLEIPNLINVFMCHLNDSKNFSEFNTNLCAGLSRYAYSTKSYPYLNAIFFPYWIRHANYYKSIK